MKFLLLVFLFTGFLFAEEEDTTPKDFEGAKDMIADRYWAGAFLIYDCDEGHWACVLKEDYKVCETDREEAKLKKQKQLPCAPIGEFPTKRSCFQRELYMTGHAHGHRFCVLDELKHEELE